MIPLLAFLICLGVLSGFFYKLIHVDTSSGVLRPINTAALEMIVGDGHDAPISLIPYEKVWAAVGGVSGLRELRRNAIILTIDCAHLGTDDPVVREEIDAIIRICAAVNISAAAAIFEAAAARLFPILPRSCAVDAAKNYCILVGRWQNLSEILT